MSVFLRGQIWWADITEEDRLVHRKVRLRLSTGKLTKGDALQVEADIRLKVRAGIWRGFRPGKGGSKQDAPGLTFGDLLDRAWARHWGRKAKGQSVVKARLAKLKRAYGSTPVASLERQLVARWLDDLRAEGLADPTLRQYLSHLNLVFTQANACGDLDQCIDLAPLKRGLALSRQRDGYYSDELEADIVRLVRGREGPRSEEVADLIEVLFETGLRLGEARVLPWSRVDFQEGILRVPSTSSKSGRAGIVPLTERAAAVLARRRAAGHALAFNLTAQAVHRVWSWVRKQLGEEHNRDFVLHLIRHTTGTRLYVETGDIRLVQRALRHTQLATTLRYEHAGDKAADTVRAALEGRRKKTT